MRKLTDSIIRDARKRLRDHINKVWATRVVDWDTRSRGLFLYVDVEFAETGAKFIDPQNPDEEDDDEELPPLMRLRFLGSVSEWEFACFDWSRGEGRYEPSVVMSGLPFGTPEECFDAAASPWR